MISRCCDPKDRSYQDYGGRGIRVCERWLGPLGVRAFVADMGARPSAQHTVGRVDNNGHYEPGNCRWETWTQQHNNRRDNCRIEIDGETMTAAQWARHVGLRGQHVTSRIGQGWHPTAAVLGLKGETKVAAHERLGLPYQPDPRREKRAGRHSS
jgi:hypothetical protein